MISTPLSAPVIGAARLRGGNAASSRGAASLVKEAVGTARACGCTGLIVVRLDSGYYSAAQSSVIPPPRTTGRLRRTRRCRHGGHDCQPQMT